MRELSPIEKAGVGVAVVAAGIGAVAARGGNGLGHGAEAGMIPGAEAAAVGAPAFGYQEQVLPDRPADMKITVPAAPQVWTGEAAGPVFPEPAEAAPVADAPVTAVDAPGVATASVKEDGSVEQRDEQGNIVGEPVTDEGAAEGQVPTQGPVRVEQNPDGTQTVYDADGTVKTIPAPVIGEPVTVAPAEASPEPVFEGREHRIILPPPAGDGEVVGTGPDGTPIQLNPAPQVPGQPGQVTEGDKYRNDQPGN